MTISHTEESSWHESNNNFWAHKLAQIKRATKLFPTYLQGEGSGVESLEIDISHNLQSSIREQWPTQLQVYVLHLSAFSMLICQYRSNEEVLIAGQVSDSEQAGPHFYHCRCVRSWDVGFFCQQIQNEIEAALRHQYYSFWNVMASLGIEDGPSAAEFFRIGYAFSITNTAPVFVYPPSFFLAVKSDDQNVSIRLFFDLQLFSADFVRQFTRHYSRVLEYLVWHVDRPIGDLDILLEADKSRVIYEFNRTEESYPQGKTLHGLFEEQAASSPDALAVIYENEKLIYETLNSKANGLAYYLRESFGVQNGDRIGVLVGRSEKMIIALLGILKAGAAYVPFNPKHPRDIISYMIEKAEVRVLLVDSETIAHATAFDGEFFALDVELDKIPALTANPNILMDDRELAYVIYTSGSYGRPKAVAIEHHAIANTIFWRNSYYGINHTDTNLQMPSFTFDSSVVDIFCFLLAGAKLVIPPEEFLLDSRYLRAAIKGYEVTRLMLTPSYYKLLVHELKGLHTLRSITVAGESASVNLVSTHYKNLPDVSLVNEYGPTENAVCSTACKLADGDKSVPIGNPISNVKVFILDEQLRPTPIGISGEIFLAGEGLARCYINQEDLTTERFIQSPIPEYYQGRMYRTGDKACWRPDGFLEFQGRMDNQIKMRGFRIELNEIESVLRKYDAVGDIVVLCKEDLSCNKYLVAYVEPRAELDINELSAIARAHLPYYMVPNFFKIIPKLPTNLNGKIDTQHLQSLDDFANISRSKNAPTTALERRLLGFCMDIFKQPALGIDDNFFALGANSLKVMEMVIKIRDEFCCNLDLLDIYTHPTVKGLAARINNKELLRFR